MSGRRIVLVRIAVVASPVTLVDFVGFRLVAARPRRWRRACYSGGEGGGDAVALWSCVPSDGWCGHPRIAGGLRWSPYELCPARVCGPFCGGLVLFGLGVDRARQLGGSDGDHICRFLSLTVTNLFFR